MVDLLQIDQFSDFPVDILKYVDASIEGPFVFRPIKNTNSVLYVIRHCHRASFALNNASTGDCRVYQKQIQLALKAVIRWHIVESPSKVETGRPASALPIFVPSACRFWYLLCKSSVHTSAYRHEVTIKHERLLPNMR